MASGALGQSGGNAWASVTMETNHANENAIRHLAALGKIVRGSLKSFENATHQYVHVSLSD